MTKQNTRGSSQGIEPTTSWATAYIVYILDSPGDFRFVSRRDEEEERKNLWKKNIYIYMYMTEKEDLRSEEKEVSPRSVRTRQSPCGYSELGVLAVQDHIELSAQARCGRELASEENRAELENEINKGGPR